MKKPSLISTIAAAIIILCCFSSNSFSQAGNALDFDGTNDYVEVPDSSSLDLTDSLTIEAWIKAASWKTNVWDENIVSKQGDISGYMLRCGDNGKLDFTIGTGAWNFLRTDETDYLSLNTWYHIAATYDGSTQKIYINGLLVKEQSTSGAVLANANSLMIGTSPEDLTRTFSGKIEEVRIWSTSRDSVQICENMYLPLSITETGLISYWQFNDGTGTTLLDTVGGNHGTLTNMDEEDWIISTIPFGAGQSNTQTETTGTVDFTGTGLSMYYNSQDGASVTVTRIDTISNLNPTEPETVFDSQYWVVDRYGTGNFDADLIFTLNEDLTTEDESNPFRISLYTRGSNADTSWGFLTSATSVDAATDAATFEGVTEFSQFIIGKITDAEITLLKSLDYTFITANFNSIDVGNSSAPGFTDIDGDGLLDLIIGESDGNLNHYEQDAANSTSFSLVTENFNSINVGLYSTPSFTDLDGDGLLDLIIGEFSGNLNHYEQDTVNSTSFSLVTENFNSINMGFYSTPSFTDIDGDGLLDMVIGESEGNLNHYEQDAVNSTSFSLITENFNSIDVGNSSAPGFTDLDGDGLLDMIAGEFDGNLNHYEQDTTNSTSFSLVTANFNSIDVGYSSVPTFTDLDGDGLSDLIIGEGMFIGEGGGNLNHYEQEGIDTFSFGNVLVGDSALKNYYLKAGDLVSNLNIECPEGYKVSLLDTAGFVQSLSITPVNHRVSDTVYLRFEPDSTKEYSGNIVHSSNGAETKNIIVIGTGAIDASPGTALDFDGTNDYVEVPDNSSLDLTDSLTIEAWINAGSWKTNVWDGNIVSKQGNVSGYMLRCGDNGKVDFTIGTGAWDVLRTDEPDSLSLNTWYHIAATYDGTTQKIYINGLLVKEGAASGDVLANANSLMIGTSPEDITSTFAGKIEEVGIWNIALDSVQIRENVHRSLEGTETGLVAYWQFNDGTDTSLSDIVGGNHGTLTNMDENDWVTSTAPLPFITAGDGTWESNGTWLPGQNAPAHPWSRARIEHNITINSTVEVIELEVGSLVSSGSLIDMGGDITINELLTLTDGVLSIGANTLFLNGAISTTNGSLTGGSSSNITFGSSGASTGLPVVSLGKLTINRANGIGLTGNVIIDDTLTLTDGALSINANTLTLNGIISSASGSLSGGSSSNITFGGSGASTGLPAVSLGDLSINRANGIGLAGDVTIYDTLTLTNGDLNLNGDTLTLGSTAILNESVGNTVKGDSGIIITTRTFNAGDLSGGINIAGMGAEITTDTALGETTIIRGHAAQIRGTTESILRYYDISPANNSGLNATLTFNYDDTEMNGIATESQMELYRSADTGNTWSVEGGAVNMANNTIILSGIDAFSRWTAFTTGFTKSVSLTGVDYSSVAWGDYDNDGDLDILLTGYFIARVYRNDGYGTFTDINAGLSGVIYGSVAWGDYDNDGDLDILLTGLLTNIMYDIFISRIYRNDGSDNFTDINAGITDVGYSSIAWGDYDNDGDLDILLTGRDGNNYTISRIYRNDGSDNFTDINAGIVEVEYSSVAWGDYDNDGDLDILLTGYCYSGRTSRVYRNDGSGTFTDINAGLPAAYFGSVAWGDYDNDGDLDILLTGDIYYNNFTSRVYRNDGYDNFTNINAGLTGVYASSVAWGDYDNDGDLDILLTGATDYYSGETSRVYRNDGSGTFTDINAGLTGVYNGSVAWGDYDNDGDLDILLTGEYGDNSRISCIYSNGLLVSDTFVANTAPNTPGILSASVSGQDVTLGWDKSTDNETPQDALTYNLRIGTSSGGVQTASPMADVSNGYRKVAALGNTNQNNSWEIKSLPVGKYYWSVQAVDNAFTGSVFATECSFCVMGITTAGITNITDTTANCGGNVVFDCNYSVTAKGIVWDTLQNPTVETNIGITNDGSGLGSFTSSLTGLTGGRTYNIRAYAINSEDTAYGGNKCFTTTMSNGGNMLDFDGIDDHVEVPWSASLNPIRFTIECWVMINGGQGTFRSPLTSRKDNPWGGYIIYAGDDNKWQFLTIDGSTWSKIDDSSNIVMDTWTHIAGTYNGSEMKLYINGNLVDELSPVAFVANNSRPLRIGAGRTETTADFHFPGKMDEVRIWNIALDSVQIRENMHRTLDGDEDSLVAYYRFDHISGTFLCDYTTNENHGVLQNMENQDWLSSTAPIPYFTVINGNWEADSVWALGQNAPDHSWARARIEHNITINSSFKVIEMKVDTSGIITITTGYQVTVSGE